MFHVHCGVIARLQICAERTGSKHEYRPGVRCSERLLAKRRHEPTAGCHAVVLDYTVLKSLAKTNIDTTSDDDVECVMEVTRDVKPVCASKLKSEADKKELVQRRLHAEPNKKKPKHSNKVAVPIPHSGLPPKSAQFQRTTRSVPRPLAEIRSQSAQSLNTTQGALRQLAELPQQSVQSPNTTKVSSTLPVAPLTLARNTDEKPPAWAEEFMQRLLEVTKSCQKPPTSAMPHPLVLPRSCQDSDQNQVSQPDINAPPIGLRRRFMTVIDGLQVARTDRTQYAQSGTGISDVCIYIIA